MDLFSNRLYKIFTHPIVVISILLIICIYVVLPGFNINYTSDRFRIINQGDSYQFGVSVFGAEYNFALPIYDLKKGLDISGGVSVLMKADMSEIDEADRDDALDSLVEVIERRVNALGVSESNVQSSTFNDEHRVIVELAGVFDPEIALETIGQVAKLDFRIENSDNIAKLQEVAKTMQEENEEGEPDINKQLEQQMRLLELEQEFPPFESPEVPLTGKDLKKATVVFSQEAGAFNQPQVAITFNNEGTEKFRDLTKENVGKRLAIYLDDKFIQAPSINTPILDGNAVISGGFTVEEATKLATQLNAGALPVPVEVLQQRTVGPTLGQEAVQKSFYAGIVGLILVIFFMIGYYKKLGLFAAISLIAYTIFTLALYKLIPVVLTLPGLAGFILSIGMAVDANILIYERIKEEVFLNKNIKDAIENGFSRSWASIRDANVATLITAFILFNPFDWGFLPTSGLVRGFALTLGLGIILSLFTGVYLTRNLVRLFYRPKKHN